MFLGNGEAHSHHDAPNTRRSKEHPNHIRAVLLEQIFDVRRHLLVLIAELLRESIAADRTGIDTDGHTVLRGRIGDRISVTRRRDGLDIFFSALVTDELPLPRLRTGRGTKYGGSIVVTRRVSPRLLRLFKAAYLTDIDGTTALGAGRRAFLRHEIMPERQHLVVLIAVPAAAASVEDISPFFTRCGDGFGNIRMTERRRRLSVITVSASRTGVDGAALLRTSCGSLLRHIVMPERCRQPALIARPAAGAGIYGNAALRAGRPFR